MIGPGLGLQGRPAGGPLDPRTVPQLMAGAIWLPGIGVTTPSGNLVVASQATQANVLTTVGVTGDIPAQTTAANGAPCWNFGVATYAALRVVAPGTAMRWTERGTYALWLKGASLTGTPQQIFTQWPELAAAKNRILAQLTDGMNTGFNIQGSIDGLMTDDPTFATPDHRWKANYNHTPGGYDFNAWHFMRVSFDYSLDNYNGAGGENLSRKLRVYVDEVYDEGTGYSAPHDGNTPETKWGDPSTGGPIRAPLFASDYRFTLGANDNLGGSWRGLIGPVYIADETAGPISAATWRRVMKFRAPG